MHDITSQKLHSKIKVIQLIFLYIIAKKKKDIKEKKALVEDNNIYYTELGGHHVS